jgi:hypothetical protein
MVQVEQRLQIAPPTTLPADKAGKSQPLQDEERKQLLDPADHLAEPDLSPEVRIELVERLCRVLKHNELPQKEEPTTYAVHQAMTTAMVVPMAPNKQASAAPRR